VKEYRQVLLEWHMSSWHFSGDSSREGFVGDFDIEGLSACGDVEL
jgi:hypothetical protein